MSNMLATIVPKSDQLNADDLIGGPKTITITKCTVAVGGEQPVSISYEGDNGKPYKPGKSMRRVLVKVWGADANAYVGRSMTLYRDEKVVFGGAPVGGIRISHMSHMPSGEVTLALTATRARRVPFRVLPLLTKAEVNTSVYKSLIDGYGQCSSVDEFASLESKRSEAWKMLGDAEKKSLKSASESTKNRLANPAGIETAEAPNVDLETSIAAYTEAGGIIDEFAERVQLSVKAIKASRGEARAKFAEAIAAETVLLKGEK